MWMLPLYLHIKQQEGHDGFGSLTRAKISSGSHFVQQRGTIFHNFGRGSPKEHFCEIILKLGHWPRRRCRLKVFFFIFSFGGDFVQQSRTILAILVESHPRNISVKLF